MQTILGAGGAIGTLLARELTSYTDHIRLVGRNPVAVNATDECVSADLLDAAATSAAIQGSEVVYLVAGLPYKLKTWQEGWPRIMSNVLDACREHGSKLVFFDNIYMYGLSAFPVLTEESPIDPPSQKGQVRAAIARQLLDAVARGEVDALIARSADFYGPPINGNSVLTEIVFKNLSQGKKAMWMGDPHCQHSFTYTPDAARATALLGNTDDAYGEVWHLPTAPQPPTGQQWIEMIAAELHVSSRYRRIPVWLVRILGWFLPFMGEMVEMYYQYDRDYVFDSQKFSRRFDIQATPYLTGIREIVANSYATTTHRK